MSPSPESPGELEDLTQHPCITSIHLHRFLVYEVDIHAKTDPTSDLTTMQVSVGKGKADICICSKDYIEDYFNMMRESDDDSHHIVSNALRQLMTEKVPVARQAMATVALYRALPRLRKKTWKESKMSEMLPYVIPHEGVSFIHRLQSGHGKLSYIVPLLQAWAHHIGPILSATQEMSSQPFRWPLFL